MKCCAIVHFETIPLDLDQNWIDYSLFNLFNIELNIVTKINLHILSIMCPNRCNSEA